MPFDRKKPGSRTGSSSPYSAYGKGGFKKPMRRKRKSGPSEGNVADGVRLQKVMAAAGIGSRRHCEELIEEGRVQIDGSTAKIGSRVDPSKQVIRVDGEVLKSRAEPVYYLVNKPEGVVSTNHDPSGRPRVIDLVPIDDREHLFSVGRLDLSSEGLILITNDGELANQLTHPRYGVDKTYLALVAGQPDQSVYRQLREGVHLAEGLARCVSVYVKRALPKSTLLEIVLNEGKNREIRRILAKVGHKVLKLKRAAIGDVKLQGLKPGEYRKPTRDELQSLRNAMHNKKLPRPVKPKAEETDDAPEAEAVPIVKPFADKPAFPKTTGEKPAKKPYVSRPEAVPVKGIRPDKRALGRDDGERGGDARSGGKKPGGKFGSKGKFEKRPFASAPSKSKQDGGGGRRDRAEHAPVAAPPRKKFAGKKKLGGKKFDKPRTEASRGGNPPPTDSGDSDTFEAGFPGRFFPGKKGGKSSYGKSNVGEQKKKKRGPPEKGYGTIIDE